jgi:hypothetical protein
MMTCLIPVHSLAGRQASRSRPPRDVAQRQPSWTDTSLPRGPLHGVSERHRGGLSFARAAPAGCEFKPGRAGRTRGPSSACGRTRTVGVGILRCHVGEINASCRPVFSVVSLRKIPRFTLTTKEPSSSKSGERGAEAAATSSPPAPTSPAARRARAANSAMSASSGPAAPPSRRTRSRPPSASSRKSDDPAAAAANGNGSGKVASKPTSPNHPR